MHIITKLFYCLTLVAALAGCGGRDALWQSDNRPVGRPSSLQYGGFNFGLYGTSDDGTHRIAVLLPTSGTHAEIGKNIRAGIETAAVRFAPDNIQINFFDTGTNNIIQTMELAFASNPDIIIGPIFAENAKMVRDNKPSRLPVLSFTSDTTAVGDGVFSMALLPSNTIEATLAEMSLDASSHFIIIAPDNTSGQIMAGTAKTIANMYNLDNVGVFYYAEHNTDSIKNTAMMASGYNTRNYANTHAKEVLSAIINNEMLLDGEKENLTAQLENLNRTDTLGKLPYDAILFLGGGDDTKSLVSFLRYYGIGANDVKLYGTSLWQDTSITSDLAMTGAKFTGLPDLTDDFKMIYQGAYLRTPSRMSALGYDAMLLAIGALHSATNNAEYLTNPSGYIGTNGLFRLHANGLNERALQTMLVHRDNATNIVRVANGDFVQPPYRATKSYTWAAPAYQPYFDEIDIMEHIEIPERFTRKYARGAVSNTTNETIELAPVTIVPKSDQDFSITAEDYKPVSLESVSRTYIDSVEIME